MTSVAWQGNSFSQGSLMSKMALEGVCSPSVLKEHQSQSIEVAEVEPEPMPLADNEAGLRTEMHRSAESMLPAGLLDEIDLHQECGSSNLSSSKSQQPVDVSTTVSMLASVLGKNTALHYESDGRRISTTGGNDFATVCPVESLSAPWQTNLGQEPVDNNVIGFNYCAFQQYGDTIHQGGAYAKFDANPGAWTAHAVGGGAVHTMMGRFCVFCGKPKHSPNQRFCSHCGEAVVA
ncbi:unnamed protein product [Durusdinium trenchii]|uniref:Zinc-ribbon domain-containing protein n=1 Tax=Durusdinium trenchii TaxID=1381693 RepID=A0ABP0QX41_9DINO